MKVAPIAIRQLADVRSGAGAPQDQDSFSQIGHPFVRAGSLAKLLDGAREDSLEHIESDVAKEHRLELFPAGTVLFAKSGMSATKGHIYCLKAPAYVVSHLSALVPHEPSDSQFLVHALRRFPPTVLIKDAAYPSIRLADIEGMKILAPSSLQERRRIAEVLDRAEALRAKRRAAIAQLDTLTQAIFLDMFGDPLANPKEWKRVPFGDALEQIDSGRSPICLDRPARADEWGVLKLGAVTRCEFDPLENKALPNNVEPDPGLEVQVGDLLFTRKNTHQLVAACALVRDTRPQLLLPDLIFRLRLKRDGEVRASYLQSLLTYPTKRSSVQKLAGGSAGSMPNISKARLEKLAIEVPPTELQVEYERRLEVITTTRCRGRASLGQFDTLFASLQDRAFRGHL